MDLAAALQDGDAFFLGRHGIAVKVCGPLLEFGEILHGLHRSLRAEDALDVDAAQRWHVDTVPMFLWPNIANQVRGGVGMSVHVTVEASHAAAGPDRAAIIRGVELL